MSSPVDEKDLPALTLGQPSAPSQAQTQTQPQPQPQSQAQAQEQERSRSQTQTQAQVPGQVPFPQLRQEQTSDEEGTVIGEDKPAVQPLHDPFPTLGTHLNVNTAQLPNDDGNISDVKSPSASRAAASQLEDDLRIVQIERQLSRRFDDGGNLDLSRTPTTSNRQRGPRPELVDEFDIATNPLHERTALYKPPEHPTTKISKFFKKVHNSSFLVRYITYITPVVLILLIPLLVGGLAFDGGDGPGGRYGATVGGVSLFWFMVWLEIVWLTLWASRLVAKLLPYPIGVVASLFTNNAKKWKDMVKQLELAATLFFWWLAIEVSFLPTMVHHQNTGDHKVQDWQETMNKVLISFLVLASLNLIEKIIIQLIAISFHLRTYEDRIEMNKFQIASLTKVYTFSKVKLQVEDSDFEPPEPDRPATGTRTPAAQVLEKAQKNTKKALNQFGDVAGKIAEDFTGRAITQSTHPSQVVLTLLSTTSGSQILARRLYRTFSREETETVHAEDLEEAFEDKEECDAAFTMFDKDMNGDISMEELEAVCVEIGRERKAITASLKDLDSVVSKLDDCFMFVVVIVFILVLVSLLSNAAASGLSSAGTVLLGLSWLFSTTASEFLQSVIFVFVKHPFDVGDRVTIYGSTGSLLTGDDYFVKEIALLYTEFKKMQGQVVQAPNSYLNTLFILNMRRSGGVAEGIPVVFKFGTTLEQIDNLRQRLLEFVTAEKREYQSNILTELRDVTEAHSITLNVVFFYKANWQNELLRLQRRNKFICALMVAIQEAGIEGPRMRYPGQKETFPLYMQNVPFSSDRIGGTPDHPEGLTFASEDRLPTVAEEESYVPSTDSRRNRSGSSVSRFSGSQPPRLRTESMAQMNKRFDFSLGMNSASPANIPGDVFEERRRAQVPSSFRATSESRNRKVSRDRRESLQSNQSIAHTTSRSATYGPSSLPGRPSDVHRNSVSSYRNRYYYPRRSYDIESGMAEIPESLTQTRSHTLPVDAHLAGIDTSSMRLSMSDVARERKSTDASGPAPPQRTATTQQIEMKHLSR